MRQLFICVLALSMLASCDQRMGSGNIVTEKRETGDFTGVSASGAFTVEITTGPVTEVKVEADDNVMKFIETEVNGDELKIRTKSGVSFNNAHFKVYITAPEINSLHSSGASNVKVMDQLKSKDKISLDASGAASISTAVDAPEVSAEITGAANIELSGKTRDYTAEVSGSGDLKSGNLKTENTDIHVSGAGNARVYASVKLKAEASGAGNVYYKGGAAIEAKTSGAGNVKNDN